MNTRKSDIGDGVVETWSYPAPPIQVAVSSGVFAASLIVFFRVFDLDTWLGSLAALVASYSVIFFLLWWPQFRELEDIKREVGQGKAYLRKSGGENTGLRLAALTLFLIALVVGPFILTGFLSPSVWFSGVLGMIMGFSLSQLIFIFTIRRWEKENSLQLEGFRVTVLDERSRRITVQRGVRRRR